ncbi:cobalt-precorrin-5B (C(1))-methyltransferase CbiD [Alkalinema sp. FACHB-956]|uniref:cobalt-precorrin-5B (C(1))-methyltransferase CbiD n=1 Tax=Alkalinema sp. FACHB-956 TaxID=2692768 RepID=UPI001682D169|nr:cobalt-precorrin-5B (C(1))-methyltransferase CbiD [Alkalinema sp. FACHB-956]MBD2326675.1 cobalt-precorrin-5B (C(1))-methyltransferase [Alkalinema sp. FACHB-956]
MLNLPRSGYTLPVFACAAAIAALRWLNQPQWYTSVEVDLLDSSGIVNVPIEQISGLNETTALAITRSDPGDNLDLTRNTPVWAMVSRLPSSSAERIVLQGGEGIGRLEYGAGEAAIYAYAKRLILENLTRWLLPDDRIQVTLILPEGRALAKRTSNAAFGVVEGLSLLGTSGIAQPLSAPGQLEEFRSLLREKAQQFDALVFCIGENGLDLAPKLGLDAQRLVKTANWLGPLLVEAGFQGVRSLLLFGYHGKLMKLAGGIFHTHHHVADGRQEILTAHGVKVGLPTVQAQALLAQETAEAGLNFLRQLDDVTGQSWSLPVYESIVADIDRRSQQYIYTHSEKSVQVGTILFDRQRNIVVTSKIAAELLESGLRM